jgi:hypothetical protein
MSLLTRLTSMVLVDTCSTSEAPTSSCLGVVNVSSTAARAHAILRVGAYIQHAGMESLRVGVEFVDKPRILLLILTTGSRAA